MVDRNLCTGCMSCVNRCPKGCIIVVKDDLGFSYPKIVMEDCIQCGKCEKVCHLNIQNTSVPASHTQKIYAAYNNDETVRLSSSSGGVFRALAESVLEKNGMVFGSTMADDFKSAVHVGISDKVKLRALQGSKYVESNLGNTFSAAEDLLKKGKTVLFSGTPCQIAALKSYLGKEYCGLYTLDIVCHGVPSPMVWEQYIESVESRKKSKLKSVSFRDKTYGWKRYSIAFGYENNKKSYTVHDENPYMNGFLKNIFLRKSCYNCIYRNSASNADITLGDFWDISTACPEWDDDKGVTLVRVNTKVGEELFESVKNRLTFRPVNKKLYEKQPPTCETMEQGDSNEFIRDLGSLGIDKALKRHCSDPLILKLKRKAYRSVHGAWRTKNQK